MAIESITYRDGFRIKFQWKVGVKGTVIYSVPHESDLANEAELMEAVRSGNLQRFSGFNYGSGASSVAYTPLQKELTAAWIDICSCDYGNDFEVLQHRREGTFFNGVCKVGGKIDRFRISANRQAVRITVQNRSKFPIQANGIGYRVEERTYSIPVALEQNQKKTLPQFDVGIGETVQLCQVEGGYPATFYDLFSDE